MTTSRRLFLTRTAQAAGAVALAACAPSTSPAASSSGNANVKKDLKIASAQEVIDGQPYNQVRGDIYGRVHASLYDTLLGRDANFKLVPRIATSWKMIDNSTWQFKIRSDVKFHNGDPLTAADVKWSIEHTFDAAAKTVYNTFATVARIDLVDDTTVNIVTKIPDPFIADKLSIRPGYVVPSKYFQSVGVEGMNKNPVGSGPYMFKGRDPGVSFSMVKNPNYWRGTPDADTITVIFRPEAAARLTALEVGEANVVVGLSYDLYDQVNSKASSKVVPVPDNGTQMWIVNSRVKPLDNKLIRQALSLSIDRDTLNKAIGKGLWKIASGPIAPFEFAYDPSLPPLPYDPDKAKALMKQAGYANDEIILESVADAPDRSIDLATAEQWKKVGFNIQVQSIDAATFAAKLNQGFKGLNSTTYASRYADPDSVVWRTMQPNGQLRYWSDPEFDQLGLEQTSSFDQARRKQIWQRMEAIMLDQNPLIYLWQRPLLVATARNLDFVPTMDANDDFGPGHLTFH
jgi:peptide/nickel transport system substrate-binding protein